MSSFNKWQIQSTEKLFLWLYKFKNFFSGYFTKTLQVKLKSIECTKWLLI